MDFIKYKCMKHDFLKKEENVNKKIIIHIIKSVFLAAYFHYYYYFLNIKKNVPGCNT